MRMSLGCQVAVSQAREQPYIEIPAAAGRDVPPKGASEVRQTRGLRSGGRTWIDLNGSTSALPGWRSFRSGRHLYPKPGRHVHQIGKRISFHLSHKIAAVKLHCNFADLEFVANLLVEQASDH